MPNNVPAAYIGLVFAVGFLVTFIATPLVARLMKNTGIMGRDVHKLKRIRTPEMCGLAILTGVGSAVAIYFYLYPEGFLMGLAFVSAVFIAGGIGIVDDLRPLNPRVKPVLTALASIPIILLGTYDPIPVIPLIGPVRLTVVYPFLIPLAIAVTSNAVNMMDVMNGAMAGTTAVISVTLAVILFASGNSRTATLAIVLFAALIAFYYYNRFPAKVFGGDTASLSVGAALGGLAVLGRIETVVIVALIPQIMNAFYGLSSVGRLYERREIRERPIRLLKNGKLSASSDRRAPVTLTRLILAAGPLGERDIVRAMIYLTLVSSGLAVLTFWVTTAVGRL